ncbi:MAG TPA: exosortase system-associated protein, TIGR04073 family [Verrucomicrobiales bacterium]|nr:exosortase system-associated protein, TIGR04073 family [Verrucomicrobiales bacterium]
MKRLIFALLSAGVAVSLADIQAPPRSQQTPIRKLGRGVSNILYGITELPTHMMKMNDTDGNSAAFGEGVVEGSWRSVVRIGYGAFEVISFPVPTYKGSYRHGLRKIEYDPYRGYMEFPPELGFESKYDYVRYQSY